MQANTKAAWHDAIAPGLLYRLQRPALQAGVVSRQLAQSVLARSQALAAPLPLLDSLRQRWGSLASLQEGQVPLVYVLPPQERALTEDVPDSAPVSTRVTPTPLVQVQPPQARVAGQAVRSVAGSMPMGVVLQRRLMPSAGPDALDAMSHREAASNASASALPVVAPVPLVPGHRLSDSVTVPSAPSMSRSTVSEYQLRPSAAPGVPGPVPLPVQRLHMGPVLGGPPGTARGTSVNGPVVVRAIPGSGVSQGTTSAMASPPGQPLLSPSAVASAEHSNRAVASGIPVATLAPSTAWKPPASALPVMARAEAESAAPTVLAPVPTLPTMAQASPAAPLDVAHVAQQVYDILVQRLSAERTRRGL